MNKYEHLAKYVETGDYDGLINLVAKKLRNIKSDNPDPIIGITIRVLSEFGLFLIRMTEHPFHEEMMRDELFKMAQKIDALLEGNTDPNKSFINVMAKISNYSFKVEFAAKRGFNALEDINTYIDES